MVAKKAPGILYLYATMSLISKLQRRNIFRVGIAYVVSARPTFCVATSAKWASIFLSEFSPDGR